jgi:hypothetical protein
MNASERTAASNLSNRAENEPVSQIWALTVFPSTLIDLVANSTPIVDFDSRLNSFLVNRESTGSGLTANSLEFVQKYNRMVTDDYYEDNGLEYRCALSRR